MRKYISALLSAAVLFTALPAQADAQPGVTYRYLDRPFLELLGYLEGPQGYNDITGFTNLRPVRPVSQMTIQEVLEFQMMLRQKGAKSSAMGRYQFIYKTLDYLVKLHDMDTNQLFDKRMQDHLARLEMARCGFYDRTLDVREVGDCLAHTWAALPLLSGKNRGKSRYVETGINSARTSPEVMEAILRARSVRDVLKVADATPTQAGFNVSGHVYQNGTAPRRLARVRRAADMDGPSRQAPRSGLRPEPRPEQ
ncbi:hypothetical protein ACGYLO_18145 [Sulfitobacter sp. 1A13353]|jgi:hypothetical protein|uniref:hypothetical protein n=1 Tax=Sulfitobacter sp. 1A13353 TaxID=3368568 RepID=UPI003744C4EA